MAAWGSARGAQPLGQVQQRAALRVEGAVVLPEDLRLLIILFILQ